MGRDPGADHGHVGEDYISQLAWDVLTFPPYSGGECQGGGVGGSGSGEEWLDLPAQATQL